MIAISASFGVLFCSVAAAVGVPTFGYQIVEAYPHDNRAFTQGLLYVDGYLYESTGRPGQSTIRKVQLATGEVLQRRPLDSRLFGEGMVNWGDRLIALTYTTQIGYVFDRKTFEQLSTFRYPGEGWGLTQDGKRLIMSDGTSELRFWDPETLKETGRLRVTDNGQAIDKLNELEWVRGEILANIWQTNRIARIDPKTGKVLGWIDLTGIMSGVYKLDPIEEVLNGIAYDAKGDRLFVTGKNWPKLFHIKLVRKR